MFTDADLTLLKQKGISETSAKKQIETFQNGLPFINIVKPATVGDGIIKLDANEIDDLIDVYRSFEGSRVKFVPASGAATRMFKHIFEFREKFPKEGMNVFSDKGFNSIYTFFKDIKKFPFYSKLYNELWSTGYDMDVLLEKNDYLPIVNTLLNEDGLNYGNLPKGLILFHKYGEIARTSLEEHIVEGTQYCKDPHGNVAIHLTVSPEHKEDFETLVSRVLPYYQNSFNATLKISYSTQEPFTDTIAVDESNNPFRDSLGELIFRPGGHGALLENVGKLNEELIFIKNIDNVAPDRLKFQTARYKKALAGMLLGYRKLIYSYVEKLETKDLTISKLNEILDFVIEELFILPPTAFDKSDKVQLQKFLLDMLNRPIRVCGMVKNQGEPGGGPFWAVNPNKTISLQIVESSQINLNDANVKKVFESSTHFNPVDLVCCIKNYKGEKFNLADFRDADAGFISIKSKDGKHLKALELPGLWNGAMSNWTTIFVEVPLETFNPVKTVNDLLREEHQA
ncbi:MAG: DUF4301 family protein [Bacteroidales bacterium]|nr:DUF4301 family protein [Bacteroidales bacterium]HPD95424.1 DUF4301 family protein [Tenuifilaceae bacterium]HRX32069.1 DUF4301 family protein [Tenuifilaceae bacterium]